MKPKTVIIWIVVILILIVLFQNTQAVTLRLFFWELSMSQIFLIPLTLFIGFGIGYLVGRIRRVQEEGGE